MEKTFAEIRKYSYIRKIVGESNYEELRKAAKKYVPIATCILVVLLVLTHFVHWELLNWLIKCTLGTSLLFLAYVFGVILLLDFGVDVEMRKEWNGSLSAPEIMPQISREPSYGLILCLFLGLLLYISVTSIKKTMILNAKLS